VSLKSKQSLFEPTFSRTQNLPEMNFDQKPKQRFLKGLLLCKKYEHLIYVKNFVNKKEFIKTLYSIKGSTILILDFFREKILMCQRQQKIYISLNSRANGLLKISRNYTTMVFSSKICVSNLIVFATVAYRHRGSCFASNKVFRWQDVSSLDSPLKRTIRPPNCARPHHIKCLGRLFKAAISINFLSPAHCEYLFSGAQGPITYSPRAAKGEIYIYVVRIPVTRRRREKSYKGARTFIASGESHILKSCARPLYNIEINTRGPQSCVCGVCMHFIDISLSARLLYIQRDEHIPATFSFYLPIIQINFSKRAL
jgi:hypothetical protein